MKTGNVILGLLGLSALGAGGYFLYKKNIEVQASQAQERADAQAAQVRAVSEAAANAKNEILAQVQAKAASPVLSKYPAGTLLRVGSEPSVYVINELGQRQWVSSRSVFDRMHLNLADVKSISQSAMNAIPVGSALSGFGLFGIGSSLLRS
jgi:LPXTG-motif cell wall-anchored protein